MPTTYLFNDTVRIKGVFQVNGVDTTPTTVALKVRSPAGTVTTYSTPTLEATGRYRQDITANAVGEWWFRWEGTGAAEVTGEASFQVRPSNVV